MIPREELGGAVALLGLGAGTGGVGELSPSRGCSRLPTTSPIVSAKVDISRPSRHARSPTLPTRAALCDRTDPSTIVQKMTGWIIIVINLPTNPSPRA